MNATRHSLTHRGRGIGVRTVLPSLLGLSLVILASPVSAQDGPGMCTAMLLEAEAAAFALPELAQALGASSRQEAVLRRIALSRLQDVILVEDEIAVLHEALHGFAAHVLPGEVAELLEDLRAHEHEREELLITLAREMLDVLTPEQRFRWSTFVRMDPDGGWLAATPCPTPSR